jgi:hypothetical protein
MLVYNPETGELEESSEIDSSNYDFGYGETPTLSDAEVEAELDRFREEYKDEIPNMAGFEKEIGAANIKSVTDFLSKYGKQALSLFKNDKGDLDFKKLLALAGGAYAASRPSGSAPVGYQGKIPKLTASRNMLTAPPVGRRPGSGGIDYGGGVTYRTPEGELVQSNERTLEELRQAAVSNPFNRGATFEGQQGLGQSDLAELLQRLNPPVSSPAAPSGESQQTDSAGTSAPSGGAPQFTTGMGSGASSGAGVGASMAPAEITPETIQKIKTEIASMPQTQASLDTLLLKYAPAEMAAAFPEFGNVADYNNATREAFFRVQQQQQIASRAAVRADMAAKGETIRITNPGEAAPSSASPFPKMSAIPQSEIDAARARLTPEQRNFIDWQISQTHPLLHRNIGEIFAEQGVNPYLNPSQAQEQIDRSQSRKDLFSQAGVSPMANLAEWNDPNWREKLEAERQARAAEQERSRQNPGPFVIGGGTPASGGIADLPVAKPSPSTNIPGAPNMGTVVMGGPAPAAPTDNWMSNLSFDPNAMPQNFDWQKYVATNTDLGAAGIDTAAEAMRHYQNYGMAEKRSLGLAAGGLTPNGFILPADFVSHVGNGSSEAGLRLLAEKYGAEPIKGAGDGMSDSIPTTIGGTQEARVANEEAFIPPEEVKRIGGGDAEKGAKKLYAMMDRVREERTGTTKQGKQIDPNKFMPGGSVQKYQTGGTTVPKTTPAGATGVESSLSNWGGDYVTNMLGQGQALANAPYQAYTGPLTAGASGLQNQAFGMAGNLQTPSSIGQAATTAGGIASMAPGAGQYTAVGSDFGNQQAQQYMNPYLQSALNPAMDEARRQADISRMADAGRLTQAGAFGGSRQAIMESEGRRNLMDKQNQMLTSGYSTAFDKAQQQFNADQARRIQEQQFGSTLGLQGLQTGIQGAQAQGQLGALEAQTGLAGLKGMLEAGGIERGIESEGIAADKAQFEEARLNPYKMVQFQQSLLSGLPLAAQSYNVPGQSGLQQFAGGATTIDQLLKILSGQTAAVKK